MVQSLKKRNIQKSNDIGFLSLIIIFHDYIIKILLFMMKNPQPYFKIKNKF